MESSSHAKCMPRLVCRCTEKVNYRRVLQRASIPAWAIEGSVTFLYTYTTIMWILFVWKVYRMGTENWQYALSRRWRHQMLDRYFNRLCTPCINYRLNIIDKVINPDVEDIFVILTMRNQWNNSICRQLILTLWKEAEREYVASWNGPGVLQLIILIENICIQVKYVLMERFSYWRKALFTASSLERCIENLACVFYPLRILTMFIVSDIDCDDFDFDVAN